MNRPLPLRKQSQHRWQLVRERILRRDCGLCQCHRCRESGALKLASEVDHIVPVHKGGSDSDDNLQAINVECHKHKTAIEQGKRRKPLIGPDGYPIEDEW